MEARFVCGVVQAGVGEFRAQGPLSPKSRGGRGRREIGLVERLACVGIARGKRQHLVAHATVVLQIRPTAGQLDEDSPGSFGDPSSHFDKPRLPRARLALAQRIAFPTPIVKLTTLASGQRFIGKFCVGRLRWWIGRDAA